MMAGMNSMFRGGRSSSSGSSGNSELCTDAMESPVEGRPRVLLVGSNWLHMGRHSGLTPLGAALAAHVHLDRVVPSRLDRLKVLVSRGAAVFGEKVFGTRRKAFWSPFHDIHKMTIETAAMRMARSGRYDCVFFESVEDLYNEFENVARCLPETRLMGVSHHPPAWWKLFVSRSRVLEPFDAVIALSQHARDFLSGEAGHPNVSFIPHGVDCEFFTPEGNPLDADGDEFHVVICGKWLRDFAVVEEVVRNAHKLNRRLIVHVVVPGFGRTVEQHYRMAMYENVHWHAGLSDEALRALYRRSHLLFLPMIDATANNAVLEAMACGLPLLVTRVGGIPDYADETMAVFMSDGDGAQALDRLQWCISNYGDCRARADKGRQKVEHVLAWSHVAAEIAKKIGSVCTSTSKSGR